ncbi:MAG: restriction endonuclease subunit S, partial [Chthoniobacteraceae bacterium]
MSGELPMGWTMTRLYEIAVLNPRHPRDLDGKLTVTFVPMPAVSETSPLLETSQERALDTVRTGYTQFADGDVLFAKITPCMENGKGAVATGLRNGLGCGTTELHVIRPHGGIDPHYLFRFLAQRSVRRVAEENFTGSAGQARVPLSFIEELEIPLAPLGEQRRMVAKLETLLGKVDACQRRLAKIPRLLKRFRQSVLAAACSGRFTADWREQRTTDGTDDTDKNPSVKSVKSVVKKSANSAAPREENGSRGDTEDAEELPEGWVPSRIGEAIESLKYGTAQKCGYEKRGVPVLRIPNVADGTIDHSDLKFAELPAKELEQLRLRPGDILMIRSNGSVSLVGKCALVQEHDRGFAYAGYLIRIRPHQNIVVPHFLNLVLSSYDIRLQIELEARSTSGVNNINSEEVRALRFSIPPLAEQHEIVRRVAQFFTLADQLEARTAKAQAYVDKLTPSLLAKAFRGELV